MAARMACPVVLIRPHLRLDRCFPARRSAALKTQLRQTPDSPRLSARNSICPDVTAPHNYVHHCHIVEHEDNDMMRPFTVVR